MNAYSRMERDFEAAAAGGGGGARGMPSILLIDKRSSWVCSCASRYFYTGSAITVIRSSYILILHTYLTKG